MPTNLDYLPPEFLRSDDDDAAKPSPHRHLPRLGYAFWEVLVLSAVLTFVALALFGCQKTELPMAHKDGSVTVRVALDFEASEIDVSPPVRVENGPILYVTGLPENSTADYTVSILKVEGRILESDPWEEVLQVVNARPNCWVAYSLPEHIQYRLSMPSKIFGGVRAEIHVGSTDSNLRAAAYRDLCKEAK